MRWRRRTPLTTFRPQEGLIKLICLNLQGADWTVFLLCQSRELPIDWRLVVDLQVLVQDEDPALLQDEDIAGLCAENVAWVLVGESSLLKLPPLLRIKAPIEKFKQDMTFLRCLLTNPWKLDCHQKRCQPCHQRLNQSPRKYSWQYEWYRYTHLWTQMDAWLVLERHLLGM